MSHRNVLSAPTGRLFDMASQYAEDVISGKEIAPKEVKIACEWFLRDLERQNDPDFPFEFRHDLIEPIETIMDLLNFATGLGTQGKTVLEGLVPFQSFFFANIFGWRFKDDPQKFKHRDVTLFIPRKNSKTWCTAIILIILMLTEDDFSEFYSICVDRELAGEVKKSMVQIIESSPKITKHFKISTMLGGKIVCKLTNSFYQSRTSEANRNNAIRPSCFIADEVGSFTSFDNISAMRSGQLSVKNPLRMYLTTAYAEDRSIFVEQLDYIKKVYAGLVEDDRMFALLYYAEKEHLWTDYGLYQSNPLRLEENYNEIRDNRKSALEKIGERPEYLTKHMNQFLPSASGEAFINVDDLRKGKIEDFDWSNREVFVGIDLAMTNDNCSFSMTTEEDGKIYADSFAFIPEDRIQEKNRVEKITYQEFIQAGKCYPCGDSTVDYGYIEDKLMEIESKYGVTVIGFAYDRYNCLSTAQRLEREGYTTIEVKQHSSVLHPATKLLKEKIMSNEFFYLENKLLEINFQNAKVLEDQNKNIYVSKKKSNAKVDMVVSLINSLWLLQQHIIFNPDSDWGGSVF